MAEKQTVVRTVDGYIFQSPGEAKRALKELEYIEKVKETMNLEQPDGVKKLYIKLTEKGYFVTPVGLHFLKELHDYLESSGISLEQYPIPVLARTKASKEDEGRILRKLELAESKCEKAQEQVFRLQALKSKLVIAVVALVVTVVGMIFIVMTNDNLGYYNAENKVLDKYSAWEEQLDKREQELLDWEEELEQKAQP